MYGLVSEKRKVVTGAQPTKNETTECIQDGKRYSVVAEGLACSRIMDIFSRCIRFSRSKFKMWHTGSPSDTVHSRCHPPSGPANGGGYNLWLERISQRLTGRKNRGGISSICMFERFKGLIGLVVVQNLARRSNRSRRQVCNKPPSPESPFNARIHKIRDTSILCDTDTAKRRTDVVRRKKRLSSPLTSSLYEGLLLFPLSWTILSMHRPTIRVGTIDRAIGSTV